ncbi:MAG: hypothetical protein QM778_32510 [Myxococcales bacterium]
MSGRALRATRLAVRLGALLWTTGGCAGSPGTTAPRPGEVELPSRWRYEIRPSVELDFLEATICFDGAAPRELRAGKDEAAARLRYARWTSPGPVRRLPVERGRIQLGRAPAHACVTYGVDLSEGGSLGAAVRRLPDGLLASPNVWLWRPERRAADSRATLQLVLEGDMRASLPWAREVTSETYQLSPNAFAFDSQAAFGAFRSVHGEHAGVPFEAALMDVATAPDEETVGAWMRSAIELASLGPGGFPAVRLHALVLPAGSETEPVAFGSVTRGGAGSVLLFVSENATLAGLNSDWVLPHELSHLFLPFVAREHAWFSEGLATYYQEVLRARGGVLSEQQALLNIARSTQSAAQEGTGRTLREESRAMHQTYAFRSVYWAGAAFFLMADVALREASQGQRSLDAVLAELRRGEGSEAEMSSLDDLLSRLDRLAGTPVFRRLADECLNRTFPDVAPVLEALGARAEGGWTVVEDARLVSVRQAIFGKPPTTPGFRP